MYRSCNELNKPSENMYSFFCKVDERAVLKHFDWPEGKADALREAAFEYQDLAKLEQQVASFTDDPKLPCEAALKKMYKLLEKYVTLISCMFKYLAWVGLFHFW